MTESQIIGVLGFLAGLFYIIFFQKLGVSIRKHMIKVYSKYEYPLWFIPSKKASMMISFAFGIFLIAVGILAITKFI